MTELAATPIPPPWNSRGLLSESDLKQAQEYYYQTHATHSRMVAEGRNAQGLMKAMVRRKLTQEMGEDFKMYTGATIGQAPDGDAQGGIRGELNYLLRHIYNRVAKDQPITSPTQEDCTILKHPHGALEVCFGMVCYYQSLLVRHASLAGNRRKVLKSILDEELFKWVWRLALGYLLSAPEVKTNWNDDFLTVGLPYVPVDRQRAPLPVKLFEFGQFMLGKAVSESHLRFLLCYYFAAYLRHVQMHLIANPGAENLEALYNELVQRAPDSPIDHVLVAVDVLLNMTGNSGESFADIFKDKDPTKLVPPQELVFILQFDPFCTEQHTVATLRALIPHFQREEISEQGKASLMPLLLLARGAAPATRKLMWDKIPIPVMVMLRNRLTNGPQDELARKMAEEAKVALEERAKKGESVKVNVSGRDKVPGVSTIGAPAPRPQAPAAPRSTPAQPVQASPGSAKSAPKPASRPAAAAPAAPAPAEPAARRAAEPQQEPPKPRPVAPASTPSPKPAAAPAVDLLDARLLVAWRMDGAHLEVRTISAREIGSLVGKEAQVFVPWVTVAFQTGQVFPQPIPVTPTLGEQLVGKVLGSIPADVKPRLPASQAQILAGQAKSLSPQKFLLAVIAKAVPPEKARDAGNQAPALASLSNKFKANLTDFLRNPSKDDYRDLRMNLTAEEKAAVAVLQKVARLQ